MRVSASSHAPTDGPDQRLGRCLISILDSYETTWRLGLSPPGVATIDFLATLWMASLVTSAVGLATRLSTWIAFLSGTILFWLPHNFGKTHHGDAALFFLLMILAVSRSGRSWSVDAWLARRRGRSPLDASTLDEESGWPLRLIQVLFIWVFFAAGLSKAGHAGLDWALSNHLSTLLVRHHYTHTPLVDWGFWIAQQKELCQVLGLFTLLLELACPLALFSRRARLMVIPLLAALQAGNALLLGVRFNTFVPLYLAWIPWTAVLARARRLWSSGATVPSAGWQQPDGST